ncbi:hypothetical protein V8E53_002809, partial [Lactarius tabidus]
PTALPRILRSFETTWTSSRPTLLFHPFPQRPALPDFEDPSRKGLFYHLAPPPTPLSGTRPVFAVSLLADSPSRAWCLAGYQPRRLLCLARFLPLLHEAISSGLAEAVDDIQASGALLLGEG